MKKTYLHKNKKNRIFLEASLLSLTLAPSIATVSCNSLAINNDAINQENSILDNDNDFEKLELKLNEEGKKLTITEFYNGGFSSLEKYTNYNELVSALEAKNYTVEFSTFVKDNNVIKLILLIDGKEGVFFLSGFKANSLFLQEYVDKFNLTLLETSKQYTSAEIYENFVNGNTSYRNLFFINNFKLSTGKIWLDTNGSLKYVISEISESPISVDVSNIEWNESETNEDLKGTQLAVEFEFSYVVDDKKIVTYKSFVFSGFMSFKSRFDVLANEFSNQSILANEDLSISIEEIIQEFNNQETYEQKFEVLKKYTNISTIMGFNPNSTLSFKAIVEKISLNKTYDGVLDLECKLSWNGIEKSGVVINAYNFNYINADAQSIKNKLTSIQLQPTSEGKQVTSIKVKEEFDKNNESLWTYVNKSGIPSNLNTTVKITNVSSNKNNNSDISEWGTTLIAEGEFSLDGKIYKFVFKPITGFRSYVYSIQEELKAEVAKINLSLTEEGKNVLPSEVNENNWKTYITNIPLEDTTYFISNLSFEGSSDRFGELNVSFNYNRIISDSFYISVPFTQKLSGLKNNMTEEEKQFWSLKEQMQKSNYLDTILKKGEKKSSWFTSYFGYNNVSIEGLRRLFDIPKLDNVEYEVKYIQYSKTNSSLSDTQMKVSLNVKYTKTNDSFNVVYLVDGFKDPYGFGNMYEGTVRDVLNISNSKPKKFNNPYIKKIWDVPTPWRSTVAGSWQWGWLWEGSEYGWGYSKPYEWYRKNDSYNWINNSYEGMSAKWTAIDIIQDVLNNSSSGIQAQPFNWSLNNKTYGQVRTGYKDDGGIIRGDIMCSLTFSTYALDDKGNIAYYDKKTVDNFYIFIYFKDDFWKK